MQINRSYKICPFFVNSNIFGEVKSVIQQFEHGVLAYHVQETEITLQFP